MKFKNIKVGMLLQHKETGKIYIAKYIDEHVSYLLNDYFYDAFIQKETLILAERDAKLFRKYKGD